MMTTPFRALLLAVLVLPALAHNGDPVNAEDVKFSFDRYKGASSNVGPRVEESGAGLIPGHAYSAPAEDLKLEK
jgi:hypothetical protein